MLIVGSILSLLWRHKQPWEREGRTHPDPALFTPPLASRLQRIQEEFKTKTEVGNIDIESTFSKLERIQTTTKQ